MIGNFLNTACVNVSGYPALSDEFRNAVLEPMRPWLTQDATEREDRERHERVMAAQRADAEARAAGLPTKAEVEAAAEAEAMAKVEATKDSAFLNHFPSALPGPVKGNFLRKAHEVRAVATEEALAKPHTRDRRSDPFCHKPVSRVRPDRSFGQHISP